MPWCDECAKFWNPGSLPAGGECPTCGRLVSAPAEPRARGRRRTVETVAPGTAEYVETADASDDPGEGDDEDFEEYRAPWHFKLMVAMAVAYLLWRLVQTITWFI